MQSVEKLRHAVRAWLVKEDLAFDTRFCMREEWRARKESYLQDAVLILHSRRTLSSRLRSHPEHVMLYGQLE